MSSVVGTKNHGAADDSSAPVKVGGRYNSTLPTLATGQRSDLQVNSKGGLLTQLMTASGNNADYDNWSADGLAASYNALATNSLMRLFNGSTLDRARSAAAAVLAAFSSLGAQLVAMPGNWTLTNAAAANTQATATKSAGAAGVRHVCIGISASLASGSTAVTVPATPVRVVVRDGASGAGTILWDAYLSVITTAGSCARIDIADLNLVGSAATAMTVEFTAAGGAGSFESVSLAGYDAS